jgi:hypothetical protein
LLQIFPLYLDEAQRMFDEQDPDSGTLVANRVLYLASLSWSVTGFCCSVVVCCHLYPLTVPIISLRFVWPVATVYPRPASICR